VEAVNCNPPENPLPVLAAQLPVLSQCANWSHTPEDGVAEAGVVEVDIRAMSVSSPMMDSSCFQGD
jgi:hypothetical protein